VLALLSDTSFFSSWLASQHRLPFSGIYVTDGTPTSDFHDHRRPESHENFFNKDLRFFISIHSAKTLHGRVVGVTTG